MSAEDLGELVGSIIATICLMFVLAIYVNFIVSLFIDYPLDLTNTLKVWGAIIAAQLVFK